jgi:EAL domain-containing protein (putative c-di-GMP-specific phosphodiesterase class I)
MNAAVQRRRRMESDLRQAIADNALSLAYQPVANLQTGRVTGFEALLRWDRQQCGRVSPAEFIPLAEENGLIVPIGAWVLQHACAEAAGWPHGLRVAVNVSAAQFRAPGLYEAVVGALVASDLAPPRLELEITESAMMQNWEETAGLLQRLKRLGVRISLDDFGTGYSSLSYLRKFPFDKIKIDQAFIRELTGNAESIAIVRAIVALCSALGMGTTAEGVETPEQFDILRAEGCTEVQGYLLSAPRPASELAGLLGRLDSDGPAQPIRRPAFAQACPGQFAAD